jgi:hypothetical protein
MNTTAWCERSCWNEMSPPFPLSFTKMHYRFPLYVESSSVRPYSLGMWPSHNPWASKAQRYDSSPETSKNRRVPLGDRIAQG